MTFILIVLAMLKGSYSNKHSLQKNINVLSSHRKASHGTDMTRQFYIARREIAKSCCGQVQGRGLCKRNRWIYPPDTVYNIYLDPFLWVQKALQISFINANSQTVFYISEGENYMNKNLDIFLGPGKTIHGYRFEKPLKMARDAKNRADYYLFSSAKIKRQIEAFSSLEYYNLLRLEMDPNVEYFCEQPYKCTVRLEDGSKESAVFDAWIYYRDGREEFQEIKYQSDLTGKSTSSQRSLKQISIEEKFCLERNIRFSIRTEKEIKGKSEDVTIRNLEFLASHVRRFSRPEDGTLQRDILNEIDRRNCTMIHDLYSLSDKDNYYVFDEVAIMFYQGLITMELDKVMINNYTVIRRR